MRLIITEKPSVARDIAKVLGQVKRHKGYLETKSYTVTWAVGHLVTLADAQDYNPKYQKWNLSDLPILPHPFRLKVIPSNQDQYRVVAQLIKRADEVVVATDAGREGQLIYELIALSTGYKGGAKRLWLSSMTEQAIRDALQRMRDNVVYKNLFYAGFARAQADWLTGINATRAITVQAGSLLTIGRVQTPTLAMIVKRDEEIQQFQPEPYFELEATFEHPNGIYKGRWFRGKQSRFASSGEAEAVRSRIEHLPGVVTKLEQKTVNEQPPQLFDLTSLQQRANQRYGFTAAQTLKLAQSLYETHKVLSYPRTDSRYISDDIVPTLRVRFDAIARSLPEVSMHVPSSIRPSKRVVNNTKVTDHHAILPTEKTLPSRASVDERKIYDLVARQTIAAFLPAAQWASTQLETGVGDEKFLTTGRVLTKPGWKIVFGKHDSGTSSHTSGKEDSEDQSNGTLPFVSQGDSVMTNNLQVLSKQTKPPHHFTDATLLSAMEHAGKQIDDEALAEAMKERGLGTPATRAGMIEKLKRDGYVQLEKKNLVATEKGRSLIRVLTVDALKSAELTGEWEYRLSQIERGEYNAQHFMQEIESFTGQLVNAIRKMEIDIPVPSTQRMRKNTGRVTRSRNNQTTESLGVCPLCGGSIVETPKAFSCANWKAKGCKFAIWKQISGHRMTKSQVKDLLSKRKTRMLKFKSKEGREFQANLVLKADSQIAFEFAKKPS